jgi:ketosteroid isomerase-like protein
MATDLTPAQMKQFVKDHFEDFVNKRDPGAIRRNMTPDFYDHDGPGGKPTGIDGDEQMMIGMHKSMPDLHVTIEDSIAEGDKVMCRNVWRWDRRGIGPKDALSWICFVALRGKQDRRTLGYSRAAGEGNVVAEGAVRRAAPRSAEDDVYDVHRAVVSERNGGRTAQKFAIEFGQGHAARHA